MRLLHQLITESFPLAVKEFAASGANPQQINNTIADFRKLVSSNYVTAADKKDINYWRKHGYEAFSAFVKFNTDKREYEKQKEITLKNASKKIYENDKCIVLVPFSHKASQKAGRGSNWCTSASTPAMWDLYVDAQNCIMANVISKTSRAENFAIRFQEDGKVLEVRDLEQDLSSKNAHTRMVSNNDISADEIWSKILEIHDEVKDNINTHTRNTFNLVKDLDPADTSPAMLFKVIDFIKGNKRGGNNDRITYNEFKTLPYKFFEYIARSSHKSELITSINENWKESLFLVRNPEEDPINMQQFSFIAGLSCPILTRIGVVSVDEANETSDKIAEQLFFTGLSTDEVDTYYAFRYVAGPRDRNHWPHIEQSNTIGSDRKKFEKYVIAFVKHRSEHLESFIGTMIKQQLFLPQEFNTYFTSINADKSVVNHNITNLLSHLIANTDDSEVTAENMDNYANLRSQASKRYADFYGLYSALSKDYNSSSVFNLQGSDGIDFDSPWQDDMLSDEAVNLITSSKLATLEYIKFYSADDSGLQLNKKILNAIGKDAALILAFCIEVKCKATSFPGGEDLIFSDPYAAMLYSKCVLKQPDGRTISSINKHGKNNINPYILEEFSRWVHKWTEHERSRRLQTR